MVKTMYRIEHKKNNGSRKKIWTILYTEKTVENLNRIDVKLVNNEKYYFNAQKNQAISHTKYWIII